MALNTVSILIPCYNSARHLPKLFEGICAQTVSFNEIICYDDGSTDDTIAVAKALGAKVIAGDQNRGASYARNRLIEAASTAWIHFHDSDDLISAHFVEEIQESINCLELPGQTCILSNMQVIDLDEKNAESLVQYKQSEIKTDPIAYFLKHNGFAIIGCYPTKLLQQIGGFRQDIRGNEDPDLHVRLALAGAKFACTEKTLVTNLTRSDSFSAINWAACLADRLTCFENYIEVLDKRYHYLIGEQAVILSNYFYREKMPALSNRALQLVYQSKIKQVYGSTFAKYITKLFGLRFYMWLSRKRIEFSVS